MALVTYGLFLSWRMFTESCVYGYWRDVCGLLSRRGQGYGHGHMLDRPSASGGAGAVYMNETEGHNLQPRCTACPLVFPYVICIFHAGVRVLFSGSCRACGFVVNVHAGHYLSTCIDVDMTCVTATLHYIAQICKSVDLQRHDLGTHHNMETCTHIHMQGALSVPLYTAYYYCAFGSTSLSPACSRFDTRSRLHSVTRGGVDVERQVSAFFGRVCMCGIY
jgi:hypothetical protein